jgi:hypothetical protein
MNLILFRETFAICKLTDDADWSHWPVDGPLHVQINDPHGKTVICDAELAENRDIDIVNRSLWRCFQIDAVMDFNTLGVIAGLSRILADCQITLMVICSFETDYLLVPPKDVQQASDALRMAGHRIREAGDGPGD